MEFYSGDFQCPDSGWGVYLIFNENTGQLTASMCETGIWDLEECPDEVKQNTLDWCKEFGLKAFDTLEEAQEIAGNYDTWF